MSLPSETAFFVKSKRGNRIAAKISCPEQAPLGLAILLHGFGSGMESKTNQRLLPLLSSRGIASLRFDFQGNGLSSGSLEDVTVSEGISDTHSVLTAAEEQFPQIRGFRKVLFGTSYGATVALGAAQTLGVKGLVLKSPIIDVVKAQRDRRGILTMLAWKLTGKIIVDPDKGTRLKYDYIRDAKKYDLYASAVRAGVPIYIVHGTRDETAPIEQSRKLASLLPDKVSLLQIDGADHKYSDPAQFDQMIEYCTSCLSETLA